MTKRERKAVDAAESHARLCAVVDRLRPRAGVSKVQLYPQATPFERAATKLLAMYHGAPADEVTDAALTMIKIADLGGISIEDACESLVGVCADIIRRDAVRDTMDEGSAHHLRLLFTHTPTDQNILDRSAEFDVKMAELAKELET
jgi:hypothetical protein